MVPPVASRSALSSSAPPRADVGLRQVVDQLDGVSRAHLGGRGGRSNLLERSLARTAATGYRGVSSSNSFVQLAQLASVLCAQRRATRTRSTSNCSSLSTRRGPAIRTLTRAIERASAASACGLLGFEGGCLTCRRAGQLGAPRHRRRRWRETHCRASDLRRCGWPAACASSVTGAVGASAHLCAVPPAARRGELSQVMADSKVLWGHATPGGRVIGRPGDRDDTSQKGYPTAL